MSKSDPVFVGADYGRVWHLAEYRSIYGEPTLCGLRQSRFNHPRTEKVCGKCERIAAKAALSAALHGGEE